MLFQPTNITPSTMLGLGSGVVDITADLPVSWQVNGTSAMTAFSITIYRNNESSTQVYTTGKLTAGCPFFGTDYTGNAQFFEYTIKASVLSSAGMANGNSYKLIIRQWWSNSDSVEQTAPAVFLTRTAPTLTIDAIPSPLPSRTYTFSATYAQAQGDAIMWFRWYISEAGNATELLLDTGNIYGSGDVRVSYSGFFTGDYRIRCVAETVNGMTADTGWIPFHVAYAVSELQGLLNACNYRGHIHLTWPLVQYIPGTGAGSWSVADGVLTLGDGASVTWDRSNSNPLNIAAPYTLIWKGRMAAGTAFTVSGAGHTLKFNLGATSVTLTLDDVALYTMSWTPHEVINDWVVAVTPTQIAIRLKQPKPDLTPSPTLYPSTTLYPAGYTVRAAYFSAPISWTQFDVNAVVLNGVQMCEWFWIMTGEPSAEQLDTIIRDETFEPEWGMDTRFLADFNNGLHAGNLILSDTDGIAIYRREAGAPILQAVATVPISDTEMVDYAVKNQTAYTYYLFPASDTAFVSAPLISDPVTALNWDWTLIECEADSDGVYHTLSVYYFGLNLSSGSISNNNSPEVLENFTPYPLIQLRSANFKSGALTSYIGAVINGQYTDTTNVRDAIMALSSTGKALFLKSRKGDLLRIRLSGPVSAATLDNSREQAQSMTLPWTEIGSADGVSIVSTPQDAAWPFAGKGGA